MPGFLERCQEILSMTWASLSDELAQNAKYNVISEQDVMQQAIQRCINSNTKSYRYVLPTQLVAKMADPSLDCRCVQAGRRGDGDFDARSVCHKVVVPFDRSNHNVLGGSPEPYVNNPLRVPEISSRYDAQQKDKVGWEELCFVLKQVEAEEDPNFTELAFKQTLIEIYRRLSIIQVTYPIPKRISLKRTQELIDAYLSVPSGGERVLAVVSALLEMIGERFDLFAEVRRRSITAADRPSGLVADVECRDSKGNIPLAVEVKDRELVFDHIAAKLPDIRSKRVSEILYIAQQGIYQENQEKIEQLIQREFVSGQNIYVFEDVLDFSSSILALVGEDGRRKFLENVGKNLDTYRAAIQHRRDWANLLSYI